MKILTTNVYVGPNLYAHFPVIRHQVWGESSASDWNGTSSQYLNKTIYNVE